MVTASEVRVAVPSGIVTDSFLPSSSPVGAKNVTTCARAISFVTWAIAARQPPSVFTQRKVPFDRRESSPSASSGRTG